jgi:hypothetical protein
MLPVLIKRMVTSCEGFGFGCHWHKGRQTTVHDGKTVQNGDLQ